MNVDFRSDLPTLAFKNAEQIDDSHIRIIILQQEIILYVETFSSTRLHLQYMKALSKRNKLKSFIAPNITDLITLLDNNGKPDIYTGGNIHGIYFI